ncbi:FAD-dependent oxidoreductase [Deinococcus humi]|uniref:NADPH-dependent 2,4-dienoyl-CoA reductase/sulfur reductase-like enzyme n=1 Tax=Deinococcus humi TaxID=662880 RepID=A0A7W8NEP7_9DEIO|nr:NADPH-dependent 2,4-dienoyl-CoA reductase/sulfur reductase-like enzyme [Deinococcus humi]GGO18741.1 oxidoreductase [Deinococcus humi]
MTSEWEVVVVGAGPAGLTAALVAAQGGLQVLLLDAQPGPGGQIWRGAAAGQKGAAGDLLREVASHPAITVLSGAEVVAAEAGGRTHLLSVTSAAGLRHLHAERIILATGATERFLPFDGWTLPGVVGAGGLQAMHKGGLDVRGRRVVVAGSGPLLLAVAAGLRRAGARVLAVAEQASLPDVAAFGMAAARLPGKSREALALATGLLGVPYWADCAVVSAGGQDQLQSVTLRRGRREITLDCDWLAVGFGLVPETRVAALLGCPLDGAGAVQVSAWGATGVPGVYAAGEVCGIGGVDGALLEGFVAGCAASGQMERLRDAPRRAALQRRFQRVLERSFALRPDRLPTPSPTTVVCRCEDVRHGQLQPFTDWTAAKLQTRCGMGACQGRVCGPACETVYGWRFGGVRAPLAPLPLAHLLEDPSTLGPP